VDPTRTSDARQADRIRLTLPAVPGYARVARLAITGLASRNGFTYDEVEDVRIAVGEVVGVLLADRRAPGDPADRDGDERLEFSCHVSPEVLDVVVALLPARPLEPVTGLSGQILDAVADLIELDLAGGSIRIVKHQDATS
jgi:hypothetical protein